MTPKPPKTGEFRSYFALISLLAMMGYQLFLCFLNTHGMAVSNALVSVCEAAILFIMACRLLPTRQIKDFAIPAFVMGYLLILWLIRGDIDLYGPRDLGIILISFWLGQSVTSAREITRIITVIFGVVFVFAILEYAFTEQYLKVFDIQDYSVARGIESKQLASYSHVALAANGMRINGRTMLPFLGKQRVSSIFFEPVSMGNFGVILAMWALSYGKEQRRKMVAFMAMATFVVIACDSRFASIIIFTLIMVRLIPVLQSKFILFLEPIVVLALLTAFTLARIVSGSSDDLKGRIMRTGELLVSLDVQQIFGSATPEYLWDSGMPYSIEMFGCLLCIILWIKFVSLRFETAQGIRLRAMAVQYCLGLLLISGTSFYSSKTATLLWFLLGWASTRNARNDEADGFIAASPQGAIA